MEGNVRMDPSLKESGSSDEPGSACGEESEYEQTATYDELYEANYDDEDFDDYLKSRAEPDDEDEDWIYR